MLEHLEKFENQRGIAYLTMLFGWIGPPLLALFVLDRKLFLGLEIAKLLLLVGAAGGLGHLFAMLIVPWIAELPAPVKSPKVAFVFASMISSPVQLGMLIFVAQQQVKNPNWGFKTWLLCCAIALISIAMIEYLTSSIASFAVKRGWMSPRAVAKEIEESDAPPVAPTPPPAA